MAGEWEETNAWRSTWNLDGRPRSGTMRSRVRVSIPLVRGRNIEGRAWDGVETMISAERRVGHESDELREEDIATGDGSMLGRTRSECIASTGHRFRVCSIQRIIALRRERIWTRVFLAISSAAANSHRHLRHVPRAPQLVTSAEGNSKRRSSRPTPRRAKSHRGGAGGAGRQDRVEPADERDAGGDGAGAVPELVRGFRPRPRQTRRPPPRRPRPSHRRPLPRALRRTALGHTPKGWEVRSLDKTAHYLNGLAPPEVSDRRRPDAPGHQDCPTPQWRLRRSRPLQHRTAAELHRPRRRRAFLMVRQPRSDSGARPRSH